MHSYHLTEGYREDSLSLSLDPFLPLPSLTRSPLHIPFQKHFSRMSHTYLARGWASFEVATPLHLESENTPLSQNSLKGWRKSFRKWMHPELTSGWNHGVPYYSKPLVKGISPSCCLLKDSCPDTERSSKIINLSKRCWNQSSRSVRLWRTQPFTKWPAWW